MRSLTFAALLALCAVSMASSYSSYRRYRSAEEVPKDDEHKIKIRHSMETLREKSAIDQFQDTMKAMRQSLRRERLYLAAEHAKNAANTAALISGHSGDRAETAAADQMKSLAGEMTEAARNGDVEVANNVGDKLSNVSTQFVTGTVKNTRSVEAEKSAPANEILANVTQEIAKTKMDVRTAKLEEATKSVEAVKVAATKAAEEQVISREDAAVIVKAADNVQKAADSGDHVQAINKMGQLHDQVDQVVAAQKGPEVAEKLVKANDDAIKPVLSSHEDLAILRAAVADVVNSDPLVPAEKKAEATEFTVKMIKEGFENANMTNRNLVATVESQAANLNLTSNATASANPDSVQSRVERHTFWGLYPYSPYYGYGLGYRNCLYNWPFSFCRRRLFGDYAFHHGFHHFYRRYHHHRHRWHRW